MKYRPEIDGLRALAVIPVILYHAGFGLFGGGYVGVDVFFVISGYLITTIISVELASGKFSLIQFYERRARRILPPLFLVIFVSMLFAWAWLLPNAMKVFSESLIAVTTFTSNIFFYKQSGYFDSANELKPLLHTWSLAVEEQYYLLFPVFLMFTWKLGRRWVIRFLVIVFVISLVLMQWGSKNHPEFTFYMLPARGWELLMGAFIAFYYENHSNVYGNNGVKQLGSSIGLLMIASCIFLYNDQTPFPSLYTIIPTLGAALIIIFATPDTAVGKLLRSKTLVSLGLVSYSAYLWHQPIFAFARERGFDEPNIDLMSILVLLSFIFAYLTWKYVESPIRRVHHTNRNGIFVLGALCSALTIFFGLAGHVTEGFMTRFSAAPRILTKNIGDMHWRDYIRDGKCHLQDSNLLEHDETCIEGKRPLLALWGDSHASSLYPGIKKLQNDSHFGVMQLTEAGCGPILNLNKLIFRKNCNEVNLINLKKITDESPDILILHGAWKNKDYPLTNEELKDKLDFTIKQIKMRLPLTNIIILGPVPVWKVSPQMDSLRFWFFDNTNSNVPKRLNAKLLLDVEITLKEVALKNSIQYISSIDALCNEDGCITRTGDNETDFIAMDSAHLSNVGAEYLVYKIRNKILLKK